MPPLLAHTGRIPVRNSLGWLRVTMSQKTAFARKLAFCYSHAKLTEHRERRAIVQMGLGDLVRTYQGGLR
jgi:hypothetical protein